MKTIFLFLLLITTCWKNLCGQDKWSLLRCVEYARNNNISVKQQDIQARITELQYTQSKLSLYPTANLSGNVAYSSGRNQNPVTFSLITQGYLSSGFTLQAAADIFNWNSKRNNIAGNAFQTQAAFADVEKLKNDLSLNIAGAYLQALLAKQQAAVSQVQVKQTAAQLANTRKLVAVGNLPELNALQLEAQLANDSSNLVTAQGNVRTAILLIKSYLNIDAGTPFEIEAPDIESIPVETMDALQPDLVYKLALQNLPQQKANTFRVEAADKFISSARGALYPTFSLFGSLGTSYNNQTTEILSVTPINAPVGSVTVGSTVYDVFPLQPVNGYTYGKMPYFPQLNQNFRQTIGLSMSVPIANGGSLRTAYERNKLNKRSLELQRDLDNQSLQQDIYKAYNDVVTSMEKYNAAAKTVKANQQAFDFATKRYTIGLLNTLDLLTTQNNLFSAKLQSLQAQYDYVFKMKVLEFYKGMGLKL